MRPASKNDSISLKLTSSFPLGNNSREYLERITFYVKKEEVILT